CRDVDSIVARAPRRLGDRLEESFLVPARSVASAAHVLLARLHGLEPLLLLGSRRTTRPHREPPRGTSPQRRPAYGTPTPSQPAGPPLSLRCTQWRGHRRAGRVSQRGFHGPRVGRLPPVFP